MENSLYKIAVTIPVPCALVMPKAAAATDLFDTSARPGRLVVQCVAQPAHPGLPISLLLNGHGADEVICRAKIQRREIDSEAKFAVLPRAII